MKHRQLVKYKFLSFLTNKYDARKAIRGNVAWFNHGAKLVAAEWTKVDLRRRSIHRSRLEN